MRLIAPFGFYGAGNIGDEATLKGFARLLAERAPRPSAWVSSSNPAHTGRVEPAFRYFPYGKRTLGGRWADYRADAVVFPGGTPIMDILGTWPLSEVVPIVAAAADAGRPVAFVGIGTERLHREESVRQLAAHLAPRVRHWSVRSRFDRDRLMGWGVAPARVTVAADMAWLIGAATDDFGRATLTSLGLDRGGPLIGVNVNNERVMLEREPALFETLAGFLDQLVEERQASVLFFCSEIRTDPEYDQAAAGMVISAMRRSDAAALLPNRYWSPPQLQSIIACCETILSTRYHVCLFAALQRVPFIALQRSDKVRDLCGDIQWPHGLLLGEIRPDRLRAQYEEIDRRRPALVNHLREAAAERAVQSRANHRALDALSDDSARS